MRFRAPVADEAAAVLAVLRARDVADLGAPDYRLGDLHDEWRGAEFDLALDARVAEDADGQIVAYAAVRQEGALVAVAPDREAEAIGARLLDWAERRERELGRARHRQWVASANTRAQALLEVAGYERVRSYWRMVRELDQTDARGIEPPGGVRLRPLDPEGDARALHALDAASFAATADYEPHSFATFRDQHLLAHDLDPKLSQVAESGGEVAGFLLARRWQDEHAGFVDILAVGPEHQRRGLGSALLRAAFAGFAAAGLREAQLGVASDNPRARRLYERLGMRPRFRADTYERPASASSESTSEPR
jgi:mycothiol synthase